ncbi:MAG: ParB N-terminal domain-containing protein [Deltaproteobacteria bacterium]|nr:ParB N-terminal domain-containing protein [Deltaproteobacteria bacterium]
MQLELRQIDLRYAALRIADASREAALAASMLAEGQRHPVLVVADAESRYVLVDGYRRVRALAALGRRPEAIEEAWLLRALLTEHGLDLRTLATRTGRTVSWVSRRLGLVEALPASVQQILQRGAVCAHAAQKVLVPLARANASHCERVAAVFAEERWSSRQIAQWWRAWRAADGAARERLVASPSLYLRTVATIGRGVALPPETPEGRAASSLGAASSACWRARTQLARLLGDHPEVSAHPAVQAASTQARSAWVSLEKALEEIDAGR